MITENGVRPIPPFDPEILYLIRSAASMVNASALARDESIKREAAVQAIELCNLAVGHVEQVVGPLDANQALVYQDPGGGFTCGSTGKPPVHIPWPPRSIPTVGELIAYGVIDRDLVELIDLAHAAKIPLVDVLENPEEIARQLKLKVTDRTVNELKVLAPSHVATIRDPTEREIIHFFYKVAADGRYLDTWIKRPYEVSQRLNVSLSEAALSQLAMGGAPGIFASGGIRADGAICAGIAWAGICIVIGCVAHTEPLEEMVKDHSGVLKY